MKKFYTIFTIALLLVIGCTKETNEGPGIQDTPNDAETPNVEISEGADVCTLEATSTSAQVTFEVNHDWEVQFVSYDGEPVNWITATPSSGAAGKHTLKLTMEKNENPEDRLVRLEVRNAAVASRAEELTDFIQGAEATLLCISLMQYAYYESKYGAPIEITLSSELRIEQCIDSYIADHNLDYGDITYLEIFGPMTEEDFEFIKLKLPNITVLDLTASDVEVIPKCALRDKQSLHYIKLPLKLRRIEDEAFHRSGIKSVNLYMPPLLEFVGINAFAQTHVSGTVIFPGSIGTIDLSYGVFDGTGVLFAHFCEGISHIYGDITSPFPENSVIFLPSTTLEVNSYLTEGALLVYCYAQMPPKTDQYGLDANLGGLLIPTNSLGVYSDYESPWWWYYSENSEYNKMYAVLGEPYLLD